MKLLFKQINSANFKEAFRKFSSTKINSENVQDDIKFSRLSQKIIDEQQLYVKKSNEYKKEAQSKLEGIDSKDVTKSSILQNELTEKINALDDCESELEPMFSHTLLKKEMELTKEDLTALLPIFFDLDE